MNSGNGEDFAASEKGNGERLSCNSGASSTDFEPRGPTLPNSMERSVNEVGIVGDAIPAIQRGAVK